MREVASRSSLFRKWIFPLALGVIVGMGIWAGLARISGGPYTILVDGKPVVSVESLSAAKTVLKKARSENLRHGVGSEVRFALPVSIEKAKRGTAFVDIPEAVRQVQSVAPVEVEGYAILVDNEPILALRSEKEARESLRLVKEYYTSKLPKTSIKPTFKEQVYIEKRFVEPSKLCGSPAEALDLMTSEIEKPVYYTIKPGDRALKVAAQYGVSLTELKALNPQQDLDRLVEGDRIMMKKGRKPITVIHKVRVVQVLPVTPPPGAARHLRNKIGKRTTTTLVTYENGEPVSEEIISQVTTWNRIETGNLSSRRVNRR
ncbi:MAG: LysM peptidoglycan-binding domain-containing protein [Armatimonadota bacterium]